MDLAPKATCHPLAVGEGEEGCRAVKMTPEWDAGTFSISTSWGTWAGKRMGSPVPSLLEGLAWVVGGLIPELVALGGGELQGTNPWRLQDHWWVFISHARLFDLYMPGGLGATMVAPPHHGWSQHPAPGGLCPLPAGPGSAGQHALGTWVPQTDSAFVQSVGSSWQRGRGRHQG